MKLSINKELYLHILFWFCVSLLPLSTLFIEGRVLNQSFYIRFLINPFVFYLNYLILAPRFLLKKKILKYIFISVFILVFINFLLSYLSPAGPFKEFEEVLSVVESKRAFQIFKYVIPAIISLAFFLLGGTISIVKDFYKKEERARIALLKQKESELSFLKAQLNPHFLFNTLNSIYSLVRNRSKEAPNAVLILSSLMRYMIYETDKEKVLLKSEINFLSDYIELQKLRLTNPDNVRFDVTGSFKEKEIAPLLLISFIENAFKYGTNHKGETKVEIAINIKKDHLHFKVLNQIGVEKEKNQRNSGIGLKNIINRLELVYQNDFNLDIDKSNNTFLVDLKINNI